MKFLLNEEVEKWCKNIGEACNKAQHLALEKNQQACWSVAVLRKYCEYHLLKSGMVSR